MKLWHGVKVRLASHQPHVDLLIQATLGGQAVVGLPGELAAGGDEVGAGAVVQELDGHHQGDPEGEPGQAHQEQPGVSAIEAQQRLERQHQQASRQTSAMAAPLELDQLPPFKAQHPIRQVAIARVVAHQQETGAGIAHRAHHQGHHLLGVVFIKAPGGFVGEQPTGLMNEGTGQRHPLALAAGELLRPGVAFVAHAKAREQGIEAPIVLGQVVYLKGQGEVLGHGQGRQQVEILIDDAEMAATQAGPLVCRQGVEAGLFQPDLPLVRGDETGDEVEQGGLATAALPQQQAGFPRGEGEIQPSNRGSVSPPLAKRLLRLRRLSMG